MATIPSDTTTMRNLVRLECVDNIMVHPNADQLEIACIGGWNVVVKKEEFRTNDIAVFFEVDSFLPVEERYEFLRKGCLRHNDGKDGFRIKTIKLRGQLSQGLLLPLSMFPELNSGDIAIGTDVSELLNVTKYDSSLGTVHLQGNAKGNFPAFIRKTDEPRIENLRKYITMYNDMLFEATEKLDGTSITVFMNNNEYGVCSRNIEYIPDDTTTYSIMARKLNMESLLREINHNVAIQGEIVGPGIQKNRLKLDSLKFFIFNIFDIDHQRYFTPTERLDFIRFYGMCEKTGIRHVPIIDHSIPIFHICDNHDKLINRSIRNSLLNPDVYLEGIVYKSCDRNAKGEVISFKSLNNEYLLKHGE